LKEEVSSCRERDYKHVQFYGEVDFGGTTAGGESSCEYSIDSSQVCSVSVSS
jgi:hypothetical protein